MLCPYDKSLQTHMTGVLRVRANNISNTNMLIILNDRYINYFSLSRYNFPYLSFSKKEDEAIYSSMCHSINLILHPMFNEASHNYYQNCVVILKCGCQIMNFYQLFPYTNFHCHQHMAFSLIPDTKWCKQSFYRSISLYLISHQKTHQ